MLSPAGGVSFSPSESESMIIGSFDLLLATDGLFYKD